MQTLAERFYTSAEQQRITAAVQAVEARTTGEVVVMVTSASHSYPEANLLAAAALALPAALIAAFTTAGLLFAGLTGWQQLLLLVPVGMFGAFLASLFSGNRLSTRPPGAFPTGYRGGFGGGGFGGGFGGGGGFSGGGGGSGGGGAAGGW